MLKIDEIFGFTNSKEDLLARVMFEISLYGKGNIVLVEGETDKKAITLILRRLKINRPRIVNCHGKDSVIILLKTYTGDTNLIGLVDRDLKTNDMDGLVITKFTNLEHEILQSNDSEEIANILDLPCGFVKQLNILMEHVCLKKAAKNKISDPKPKHIFFSNREMVSEKMINLNAGEKINWDIDTGTIYKASKQAMLYAHKKSRSSKDQSYENYICDWVGVSTDNDEIINLGKKILFLFK